MIRFLVSTAARPFASKNIIISPLPSTISRTSTLQEDGAYIDNLNNPLGDIEDVPHPPSFMSSFLACCKTHMGVKEHDMSVSFVSPMEIKNLNGIYRGKNEVTDVLSFCFEADGNDDAFAKEADPIKDLGDLYLCLEEIVARKQPAVSLEDELRVVIAHGLLHLCGYDHMNPEDASKMATMEKKLLSSCSNISSNHSMVFRSLQRSEA